MTAEDHSQPPARRRGERQDQALYAAVVEATQNRSQTRQRQAERASELQALYARHFGPSDEEEVAR